MYFIILQFTSRRIRSSSSIPHQQLFRTSAAQNTPCLDKAQVLRHTFLGHDLSQTMTHHLYSMLNTTMSLLTVKNIHFEDDHLDDIDFVLKDLSNPLCLYR